MSLPSQVAGYQVVRELGRGGMGVVYEVRAPNDPRPLALKLIQADGAEDDGEAIARFLRETELMARVQHPHVLRVVNGGTAPETGAPFLVTERIQGEDLDATLRTGAFGFEQAARLLRSLADAVAALHAHGILHRDLKPANVMLREDDGTPVLLDFGLARDPGAQTLTQSGAMLGTPGFMAPEQVDAARFADVDARLDVYGLGAILYYVLCGKPPIEADGVLAMAHRTFNVLPDWSLAPDAPPALVAIGHKALAKAPEARYPSAAALRDDLDRFLRGEAVEAPLLTPAGGSRRGWLLGALGLALAAAGGSFVLRGRPPEPKPASLPPSTASPTPNLAKAATSPFLRTTLVPSGEHPPGEVDGDARVAGDTVLSVCRHRPKRLLTWQLLGGTWSESALRLPVHAEAMSVITIGRERRLVLSGPERDMVFAYRSQGAGPFLPAGALDLALRRERDEAWGVVLRLFLIPGKNAALAVQATGFPRTLRVLGIRWEKTVRWSGRVTNRDWAAFGRPESSFKDHTNVPSLAEHVAVDASGAVLAAHEHQLGFWPLIDGYAPQPRYHTFPLPQPLTALAANATLGVWGDATGRIAWSSWAGLDLKRGQRPEERVLRERGPAVQALALDNAGALFAVCDRALLVYRLDRLLGAAPGEAFVRKVPLAHRYRLARVAHGVAGRHLLLVPAGRCAIEVWNAERLRVE